MRIVAFAFLVAGGMASLSAQPRVEGYYPGDRLLWDRAFKGLPSIAQPAGRPVGGIAPHHDIDLFSLGGYYRSLATAVQPPVIVLLSPNHFEWGTKSFILPRGVVYGTIDDDLVPDDSLGARLLELEALAAISEVTDQAWPMEHGVYSHTPFLKHFFPKAKVLPLLIKMGAPKADLDVLVQRLDTVLPPGSLVLGSVDFSHYQIRPVADFHDLASAASIRNLDARILDKEIDSPESVYAVMRFSERRGAPRGVQVALTSSGDFSPNPLSETTSHQYWTFVPGLPDADARVTLVVAGRSSRDLRLGLPLTWPWDRYETAASGVRSLKLLAGKEGRFLGGNDAYLFSPLEGWKRVIINGLRCGFYGWSEEIDFDRQLRDCQVAADLDFVAIVRDGGPDGTSFSAAQVQALVDGGARLVVDRTGTVPQEPRLLGRGLWVRCLGDLVTEGTTSRGGVVLASWKDDWRQSYFSMDIAGGLPQSIHQFWSF